MPNAVQKKQSQKVIHNHYISVDTWKLDETKDFFRYLGSPNRIFWINFLAGTGRGLGFVLGTVAVITILTFIVGQVLSDVPWVGELFRRLDDWLRQNLETYS